MNVNKTLPWVLHFLIWCVSAFLPLVNTAGAEVLYKLIADWCNASPTTTVLDICCGTGTIGLSMAKVYLFSVLCFFVLLRFLSAYLKKKILFFLSLKSKTNSLKMQLLSIVLVFSVTKMVFDFFFKWITFSVIRVKNWKSVLKNRMPHHKQIFSCCYV